LWHGQRAPAEWLGGTQAFLDLFGKWLLPEEHPTERAFGPLGRKAEQPLARRVENTDFPVEPHNEKASRQARHDLVAQPLDGRRFLLTVCWVFSALFTFAGLALHVPQLWLFAAPLVGLVVLLAPRVGLYAIIGATAIGAVDYDPLTRHFAPLYQPLAGLTATPVEVLVLLTLVAWCLEAFSEHTWLWPSRTMLWTSIGTYLFLLLAIAKGVSLGGDLIIALWEVRALLLVFPVMLLTAGLIGSKRQVYELLVALFSVHLAASAELAWSYLAYVRPGVFEGQLENAFSHDGTLLVALLMVACFSWALWGPNRKQRLAAFFVALAVGALLLASRRRAGLIAGEVGLLFLGVALLFSDWRRWLLVGVLAAGATAGYLAVFWNNTNALGQPARAFQTVFQSDSLNGRDRESDNYRRIETSNIWLNIKANVAQGIGFGRPYAKPIPQPDLSSIWPFWDYIPHNTVLWLWMKAGVGAFVFFWLMIASGIAEAMQVVRSTRDQRNLAIVACFCAYLVMTAMFAYVDLGLSSSRVMIMLGFSLGLITCLWRFEGESQHSEDQQAAMLSGVLR
jgi:hypothetical protein